MAIAGRDRSAIGHVYRPSTGRSRQLRAGGSPLSASARCCVCRGFDGRARST